MLLAATVLTYSLMTLSLEYEPAALNLVTAPSAAVNCATHIGTRTDMRPLLSAMAVMLLAVPPVTQPPQTNPIVIAATAPKAIPWSKRVRASPCRIAGIRMACSFVGAWRRVKRRRRWASALREGSAYQIAPSDGTPAAATIASSDFGRRRFLDSIKVSHCYPVVRR